MIEPQGRSRPTNNDPRVEQRIVDLVQAVRLEPTCSVQPSTGLLLRLQGRDEVLPFDFETFYRECGGLDLFPAQDYGIRIVGPEEFFRANPVIVGEEFPGDRSEHWYVIGATSDSQRLTTDCSSSRLGYCYDSFHETHGVAGSCAVIALSFADLLESLLNHRGHHWSGWNPSGRPWAMPTTNDDAHIPGMRIQSGTVGPRPSGPGGVEAVGDNVGASMKG